MSAAGHEGAVPLLLVHGLWHGAWCYEAGFRQYFDARGVPARALDLRGHPKAAHRWRHRFTSLRRFTDDVAEAARALEAEYGRAPVLVGHSMGARVVRDALARPAAACPAAGVVQLAPAPTQGVLPLVIRLLRAPATRGPTLRSCVWPTVWPLVATPERAWQVLRAGDAPPAERAAFHARLQEDSHAAFLGLLRPDARRARRAAVRRGIPFLVLGGAADAVFTPAEVQDTAAASSTEATLLSGLAHDLMLDTGWETTAVALLGWLQKHQLAR